MDLRKQIPSCKGSENRPRKREDRALPRGDGSRRQALNDAATSQRARTPERTSALRLKDAAAPDGLFLGDPRIEGLRSRGRRRLDGLRTKPPCHRSDLIYRLCQPGLIDQPGLVDQGLPGLRWTARPAWPPSSDASASCHSSDASASRRTACGDRFLHRQNTSPSLERHRTQRERLLRPLRTSACWTSTPPPLPPSRPHVVRLASKFKFPPMAEGGRAALAAAQDAPGRFPPPLIIPVQSAPPQHHRKVHHILDATSGTSAASTTSG